MPGQQQDYFHLESSELRDIAGFLPTDCRRTAVAFASCLFLTSYPFGILTLKETPELNTGGLSSHRTAPHKLTPMLGVHAPERRGRGVFKWKISRRRRVILVAIRFIRSS